MASSFREILWLDTDITLLYRPEELFDSPQYQSTSAISSESTLLRLASRKHPSKHCRSREVPVRCFGRKLGCTLLDLASFGRC